MGISQPSWPTAVKALLVTSCLTAPALARAQDARAPQGGGSTGEIVVTAQKREQSLQQVPISIQALTTARLDQLQVRDFKDVVAYLPSVAIGEGSTGIPGNTNFIFRGVATDAGLIASATLPTVGIYLDEQPVTSISGNLDIHAYDIARVEALAGPQGTLYGASSEAGTIRIITNKPNPNHFSASYTAVLNQIIDHGIGGQIEGYVNAPIVPGKAALRAGAWYEHDGGYISNDPHVRTFPTSGITQNNSALLGKDLNEVDIYGARAALGIDLNDAWTVTPSVIAQQSTWKGSFRSDDTKIGELAVGHFFPEYGHDTFYQAGGVITGRISDFELTSAGYYLSRSQADRHDYSDYGFYYDAIYGSGAYFKDAAGNYIDPSQLQLDHTHTTKLSQEVRLASPQDKHVRGIVGAFYQRATQEEENNYQVLNLAPGLSIPGHPGTAWLTRENRVDRDYAVFGQVDVDVTSKLTLTGGLRGYAYDNDLIGFYGVSSTLGTTSTGVKHCIGYGSGLGPYGAGLAVVPGTPCTDLGVLTSDGAIVPKASTGDGYTWRANATYKFDRDHLVYFTASTGFRPGGINRAGTAAPFGADRLTNYEFGTKNSFLDRRLTLNLTGFWEVWDNVQVTYQAPGGSGVASIINAGGARSRGIEGDFSYRTPSGLSLSGSGTYVDAALTTALYNGGLLAPAGTRLPLTPRFKGDVIGRYDWTWHSDIKAHAQLAVSYTGMRTSVISVRDDALTGDLPAYTTLEAAIGAQRGAMSLELFVRNLTDSRGQTSRAAECNIHYCGPSRVDATGEIYRVYIQPRTIGLRFGQTF